jgi:SAM-dependent methyltransferase
MPMSGAGDGTGDTVPGARTDATMAGVAAAQPGTYVRVTRMLNRRARPLRWRYYVEEQGQPVVARLPGRVRAGLGLDDDEARRAHRIEIGAGPYPTPGYVHVDLDPEAEHLEALAPGDALPFPDGWATELLAIHILEHVPPPRLEATLREWLRVLAPGGVLRVHVPDSAALMRAWLATRGPERWALNAALTGVYASKDVRGPDELAELADHQTMFDAELLRDVLAAAGFAEIEDRTDRETDRHTLGWRPLVDRVSLIFRARRP